MIKSFLKHILAKRYSQNTITSYNHDLQQFSTYLQEIHRLEEPEHADHNMIRSWVLQLTEEKANVTSINRKIATLKSFYKYLQNQGFIKKNPAQRLKPMKVPKKAPIFVEEEKMLQLLNTVQYPAGIEGLRDKFTIEILYGTGMRLSELINLQIQHVDFQKLRIRIPEKNNLKKEKERNISVAKPLLDLLQQYEKSKQQTYGKLVHNHVLVTDEGKPAYPMLIYRTVKKYLQLITDQEKKSPHVLRHSFATHLLNKGADLHEVKDMLGHTTLSTTQAYSHNSLDQIKEIFNQAHPKA
ncbi:tyrosine-type recombinase/integrase [Microscilla marina]|uniref:Integrase, site-specific recombinase n=1 Tax=Microscilla marina ATCC 23134 TaxID=313606 RepID=A1ZNT4_MICM2|nr:tyrosine-type recombinase/integrase [Microscilla marina]EAY27973.1 integrase, site-specific recombinase [Microscilla marina ATCC 23134]